jgi:FkbM family methyltransferase
MTFISYAQNNEDVLLWRALGHVKNGFYIDVGANDPVEHSVTKSFYDAGWSGISIEPLPVYHQSFLEQRPRDVNLAIAAGAVDGELTLYDVPAVRGWASPEESVARLHRAEGHEVAEVTVPVRTLTAVCAEHVKGEIHFLKIDVEGFEGEVLRGMDFARWRPWVLVIEATLPNSRSTNHHTWEPLVLDQRYRYAWFDGLNRYYVAEEHAELLAHLDIQPNVFDDYISHHLDGAWKQIDDLREEAARGWGRATEMEQSAREHQAQHQLAARHAESLARQGEQLRERLHEAEARARELDQQSQALTQQLHASAEWGKRMEERVLAMEASTSWRITAPLRRIMRRGPDSVPNTLKRKAKGAAGRFLRWLSTREALRRVVVPLVMRSPRLRVLVPRLMSAARQAAATDLGPSSDVPHAQRDLPQSARDALAQLRRAYEPHKK